MNYELMRLRNVAAVYLLLFTAAILQACGTANPLARAETLEQRAFAAYGTFVVFEEQAAKLISSGELSNSAVRAIGRADAEAKPVADSLLEATLEVGQIREEFLAGGSGEERLVSAMNNLNDWLERALPLIDNLVGAVKGEQ